LNNFKKQINRRRCCFDFNSKFGDIGINRGLVPTVRTFKSGFLKTKDWSELEGKHLYAVHFFNNVIKKRGINIPLYLALKPKALFLSSSIAIFGRTLIPLKIIFIYILVFFTLLKYNCPLLYLSILFHERS